MARLIVIKGADEGKQFDLEGDHLSIGRDSTSRVRLCDTEVSRRHAEFVRTTDGVRLLDIGSANGTFVNGQSIRDVLLQAGDQIQVGQTVMVFTATRPEAPRQGDLADRISMITRQEIDLPSAIIKTVSDTEGSRLLARPDAAEGPWLKSALANLGLMYETTQAVSHILDLNQLLDRILELIFKTMEADRGCVMLRSSEPGDALSDSTSNVDCQPKAVRWRDGIPHHEKIPVSKTIMDFVLKEKKGVLVSDAAHDERFQAVQSILKSGIREIICVPMKGRHETLGVLYLDTRTSARDLGVKGQKGKFSADHLTLASAIAHQASLAIEETRYYQAMLQSERLAAIGQTIASLSHHIKNILQGLKSGGEILKMGITEQDQALLLQGWKIVEKNQGKVFDLVQDMLSYSKDREPNIEEVDLNKLAADVVELLAARATEKGVALTLECQPDLPSCQADPEGLHRALLNIVGNALDAVEEASEPSVRVSTHVESSEWISITVLDNGHGIPSERINEIFRPFVSSKGARGTGLGLAVSRKILREHGGDITVQSSPGHGSTFTLRLPQRTSSSADSGGTMTDFLLPPGAN